MLKARWTRVSLAVFICLIMMITTANAKNDPPSKLFSIKMNGTVIPVYDYKDFTYAYFIQKGKASIAMEFSGSIEDVRISPLNRRTPFKKNGNTIQFDLLKPEYTVITINKKHRLFLFGDNEVHADKTNIIRITDYVIPNDTGVVTKSIQKALDDASQTGKQLIFSTGTYISGSLFVHKNTNIFFEQGAVLKASENKSDFVLNKEIGASIFITVKDARNVVIGGLGIIDGSGKAIREKYGDKGRIRLLTIQGSKNVSLDGITLRDPAAWNTHIFKSEDVGIKKLKLLNDITVPTTDGFDPDASSGITIEDCFAYCSDDNVAVKLTPRNADSLITRDIKVKNCVFLTLKSSLKIGTETRGALITDVVFENNDVIQSDRGMAIYVSDGAMVSNIRYLNNRFEEYYPDLKQMGLQFRINKRNPDSRIGQIKGVLVKDCNFYLAFPKASEVSGLDKEHRAEVLFDNLTIAGKKCLNLQDANIQTATFSDISFE